MLHGSYRDGRERGGAGVWNDRQTTDRIRTFPLWIDFVYAATVALRVKVVKGVKSEKHYPLEM